MTIVQAAVVVEAALIALLLLLQFRRPRAGRASATSKAPANASIESSKLVHGHFGFSRASAADATSAHHSDACPEQPSSGELSGPRQSLRQSWGAVRARLAMIFAQRIRRVASRRGAQDGREEPWVNMPDRPRETARQLQRDEQLRCTLELLPFAILVSNQHRQIVLANTGTEKLFGYGQDELIGASADMLIPGLPGYLNAAQQADAFVLPPFRAVDGACDQFARRKDGTEFPAEITTNHVSSDGELRTLTVVIDRTERHELRRNRLELAHLTRVSTLGELVGSLAHELNQPLTAILSNAQAAQRFMATQPIDLVEVREILQDLVQDNHRASEVIRRIRALVKKGELEAAPLDLAAVIDNVVLLVHSDAIVRGIRVLLNIAPNLPPVLGDSVQLQQVVLNLLLNAFDAMEPRSMHDRVVVVSATLESTGLVRVAVRDRGPGLTSDQLNKLFKPFCTSKRDGLGLGLSISRSIVEMHGGRIWAENNMDKGASFYFTLPTEAATGPTYSRQPT
ncbi:sensor histidine kinase [Cupriavidus sp. D39]|uniref:sensor histidine kinase n=1 Tax=Cupriavidus sp. D39 TaxID=2997877 RepID=UPI00227147EA|nr:PAS domain-containing sensor histidine kinase [Cupriavidus sp. D39]MCY0853863.1 PAS domain-containing sensor histidine kinase [Cupriavidus sp. D39]